MTKIGYICSQVQEGKGVGMLLPGVFMLGFVCGVVLLEILSLAVEDRLLRRNSKWVTLKDYGEGRVVQIRQHGNTSEYRSSICDSKTHETIWVPGRLYYDKNWLYM